MTVHVIGAGLSGLAAAVRLTESGQTPVLWEATPHAGGRARSFDDSDLGCRIDNGAHLILSGNTSVRRFVNIIGAGGELEELPETIFPFFHLRTGAAWQVQVNNGRLPWWLLSPLHRPPGTGLLDIPVAWRHLQRSGPDQTVADIFDTNRAVFRYFWGPLAVAILNTPADQGSARLFAEVLKETVGAGGRAARPMFARRGLSEAFADPALAYLDQHGARVHVGKRIGTLEFSDNAVTGFVAGGEQVRLSEGDQVILAVPPGDAATLVPDLQVPDGTHAILNAHFRMEPNPVADEIAPRFLGLVGGLGHWMFRRGTMATVTISAADGLMDAAADDLAPRLWSEVAPLLCRAHIVCPPFRVIKERRATFAATPANEVLRPEARTAWNNLVLAGDWTATGLPATLEGAVRSGFRAADLSLTGN